MNSSSSMADTSSLPPPVDLSHYLSRSTKKREASSVKKFYKYFQIPGIGQLAGGLPNINYFPYDTLEAKLALPNRWKPTPNKPVEPPIAQQSSTPVDSAKAASKPPPAADLLVPKEDRERDLTQKIDLSTALQYGQAQGYPALYSFIRQFTRQHLHPHVPYRDGPEIILTCGSTDGFSKTLQAFNNEWSEGQPVEEREAILCEEFAYMNAIQTARPRGLNIVPVKIDDEGMKASGQGGLQDVLENWDFSQGKRPHLMYTVTIGQNPTSGTLSVARRKEIYALCVQYDIIIVEDDPYWYLQFPSATPSGVLNSARSHTTPSSGYEFLDSLIPSYLSIDYQGRVVRLDTFSKTVAPGCRLGWITAQPAVVERILRVTETTTQQPSGFVQSVVAQMLLKEWGMDGWVRWLEGLRGNYERRMVKMSEVIEEGSRFIKSRKLVRMSDINDEWNVVEHDRIFHFVRPVGGMFIWIRFAFDLHPLARRGIVPEDRLARALWVWWTRKPYRVLAAPGTMFAPTPEVRDKEAWRYFRVCFAAIDEEEVEPVAQRFVQGAQAFWGIRRKEVIDGLLEEEEEEREQEEQEEQGWNAGMAVLTGVC